MTTPKQQILIYTDGSCLGNPGPGGWAAIVQTLNRGSVVAEREMHGTSPVRTTNNRMEMQAAISSLLSLCYEYPAGLNLPIIVRSDSNLLIKGMNEWRTGWERRGWKKADGKAVENADLWQKLIRAADMFNVTWEWVRGHANDPLNIRVDGLARHAADQPPPPQFELPLQPEADDGDEAGYWRDYRRHSPAWAIISKHERNIT